jgi:hypothetical protein
MIEIGEGNNRNIDLIAACHISDFGLIVFVPNYGQKIPVRIGMTRSPP